MLRKTFCCFRYRTAWRELLHPLPVSARRDQWLKRDTVEINEGILRRPYYTIKSYAQPSFMDRDRLFSSSSDEEYDGNSSSSRHIPGCHDYSTPHHPSYTMVEQLKRRHATSLEKYRALRDELQFPGRTGPPSLPPPRSTHGREGKSYTEEYGGRLRPRYPQSWDTVPPHQPSASCP